MGRKKKETQSKQVPIRCLCGAILGEKFSHICKEPGKEYCKKGDIVCPSCGRLAEQW